MCCCWPLTRSLWNHMFSGKSLFFGEISCFRENFACIILKQVFLNRCDHLIRCLHYIFNLHARRSNGQCFCDWQVRANTMCSSMTYTELNQNTPSIRSIEIYTYTQTKTYKSFNYVVSLDENYVFLLYINIWFCKIYI